MNNYKDIIEDIVILLEFILSDGNNLNGWKLQCINNIRDKMQELEE